MPGHELARNAPISVLAVAVRAATPRALPGRGRVALGRA